MGPRNRVLDGVKVPHRKRQFWNCPAHWKVLRVSAAMYAANGSFILNKRHDMRCGLSSKFFGHSLHSVVGTSSAYVHSTRNDKPTVGSPHVNAITFMDPTTRCHALQRAEQTRKWTEVPLLGRWSVIIPLPFLRSTAVVSHAPGLSNHLLWRYLACLMLVAFFSSVLFRTCSVLCVWQSTLTALGYTWRTLISHIVLHDHTGYCM